MTGINKQELIDKITALGKSIGFLFVIYVLVGIVITVLSEASLVTVDDLFATLAVQAVIFVSVWFTVFSYYTDIPSKVFSKATVSFQSVKTSVASASVILIVYMFLSSVTYALVDGEVREHDSPLIDAATQSPESLIIGVVFMFVFVAVSEELVFRAGIYEVLKNSYSVKTSAVLSAIIFALPHITALELDVTSALTFVATGGAGLAFTLIYEKTDNIAIPIIAHGVYNSLLLIIVYFA